MRVNIWPMVIREIGVIDEACCTPLVEAPLSEDDAERLASALRVVADPARLRLLSLITASGEACVCDLTEPLGLTQPTVSHHLKVLREAGLVTSERRGVNIWYAAKPTALDALRAALGRR